MRKILLTSLGLFTLLLFAACGPAEEDATKVKEIEDIVNNRQVYQTFVGFYKGEVEPVSPREDWWRKTRMDEGKMPRDAGRNVPIIMEIRIEEVPNGVDSSGRTIFRPELRGFYQRMDMDPGFFLNVRRPLLISYREDLGQLLLTNSDTIVGGRAGIWTLSAVVKYEDNKITGDITYDNRVNGKLRVRRSRQ